MRIIISTVQRPNKSPYLDRLITSIRQNYDGLVTLVVGGSDRSYVERYVGGNYKIYFIEDEEIGTVLQKAAYGYWKCLTLDTTPCLILEDDAELVKEWYDKLLNIIQYTADDKYIISLKSPDKNSVPMPDIDIPSLQPFIYQSYLSYDVPGYPTSTVVTYSNTTGIYYTESLLKTRLPEFIKKFSIDGDAVYDVALGQFMFRYNLPIHIAVPNLLKEVDSSDSSMGSIKKRSLINYTDWDFTSC
jgi:hypothetical protein